MAQATRRDWISGGAKWIESLAVGGTVPVFAGDEQRETRMAES